MERPDVAMGIHPGLHAEGVFEFWEPTLDLLLEENIVTVFTMFSQEEYEMSLLRLDGMFAKYVEIKLPNCLQVCWILIVYHCLSSGIFSRERTALVRPM